MSINIKDPETDRLARDLAAKTGESLTTAIRHAVEERLKRESARSTISLADEIMEISRRASRLPRKSSESADEILGYDERGLPS
jgi:antitoxin VapB